MFAAMKTKDSTSGKTRGYIIIADPNGSDGGNNSDSNSASEDVPGGVTFVIVIGAISYVCFTSAAVIVILASIAAICKNRGKRTAVAV